MLVVEVVVVAGLLIAVAAVAAGRGDPMSAAAEDSPDPGLPDGRVTSEDVSRLRLRAALRGYRMSDVDEALARLQQALAERDEELGRLRAAGARDGQAREPFQPVPPPGPLPTHEPEPVVPGPEPVVPSPEPVPEPEPVPGPEPEHGTAAGDAGPPASPTNGSRSVSWRLRRHHD